MTPLPHRLARVLELLTQGRTPEEIAAELGVREKTATHYIWRVQVRLRRWKQAEEQWRDDFLAISVPDP
jgi:DNA-binding NarL/FixJ family response regulator